MKVILAALVLGVVVAQMTNAYQPMDSLEVIEAQEISSKLAELKRDVEVLERKLDNLEYPEDPEHSPTPENHPPRRQGKAVNKKSLSELINWFGTNVLG
uniref:Uncharacterized protein n=1 Tax=Panagrolaimus superbus TaxID=310955 RepID=A0A914XV44_9BILA